MPAQVLANSIKGPRMSKRRMEVYEEEGNNRRGGLDAGSIIKFVSALLAVLAPTVSFIWFAATQNAAIAANHQMETTAIAATNVAVTQLQSDKRDVDKQMLEILVHLSSMDQTLKNIMTYGVPRPAFVPESGGGNTIINTATPPSKGAGQ